MKLRATQAWTTATGKRRRIRLFESYCNMRGRCRGGKSIDAGKYWNAGCEFKDWEQFRAWALSSGYGKGLQLDRIDGSKPYSPDNCQWIGKQAHGRKSFNSHKPTCRCVVCGYRVRHTARATVVTWTPGI
jgi:hypothetical protein